MSAHRWAAVAIVALEERQAAAFADTPILDRLDSVCEVFGARPGELTDVWAVRGPICADCRVSWEDVHADRSKPWPCPGPRPDQLGGSLLDPPQSRTAPNRQQRRAKRRQAEKDSRGRRNATVSLTDKAAMRKLISPTAVNSALIRAKERQP